VLATAFGTAAGAPGGIPRLLAYLHHECDQAWDISYHFPPIWATLRGALELWAAAAWVSDPVERTSADAFAALLVVLDLEILLENAVTCGLLREAARLGTESAAQAGVAAELAGQLTVSAPPVARYVGDWGVACAGYDGALARAAAAIADLLDGSGDRLDEAIAALRAGEAQLGAGPGEYDTPDASELRAHRYSLEELRAARDRPWLYLDTARVVYLYPFGLRGREPVEIVEQAAASAAGWRVCGVGPVDVHERFNLDDVWHSSDAEGRRFDGVQVLLPVMTLRGPAGAGDQVIASLRAELRLSRLGNHYLRFEGDLVDADPQDVYAALMRAAPEHGRADVRCGDGVRHWARLADFAIDLIEEVSGALGTTMSAAPGMFQVLLNVYAASIGTGPGATERAEVRTLDELTGAVGAAVLFRPVANMINTLAEWVRYPKPEPAEVITGATNLRDHIVMRTCNTTVQVALGLAHWSLGTAGTVAEFAATLEGLFAAWFDELGEYHQRIREIHEPSGSETLAELVVQANDLNEHQIRLHKLVTEARSTLSLITSPALVASPVVAQQLAAMVSAAGTEQRSADLSRRAEEVLDERLGRAIEAVARQRADRDARRERIQDEVIAAILAAVGFSGLGQIFQAGYGWTGPSRTWAILTVVIVLALSIGLLTLLRRVPLSGRRVLPGRSRSGKDGKGATGHG
jgi:hypothetical protein